MADLVKNPVSFVGVRRSKFGRKGRSTFGVFRERAIDFFISAVECNLPPSDIFKIDTYRLSSTMGFVR
ncbi:hypothetical protein QUA43_00675 [Microcoleus sp. N9_B4]|uniref:hypothetical protein n=1 Tax=Microcoleus sp. N9_B4 TaxID=3055386 RepID=UPI002FD57ADD